MSFPILTETSKGKTAISTFGGLNQRLEPNKAEFSDMKNISTRFYPALATRQARGTGNAISNPNGIFWKNNVFYVAGTKCYYNGSEVQGLTVTNGEKILVGIGAYIVIFPDKVGYNTATGAIKYIETSFTPQASVSFDLLSEDSVYTKITVTGIRTYFDAYDNVTIAGVTHSLVKDYLNGTKVITDADTNCITVTAAIGTTFQTSGSVTVSADGGKARITAANITGFAVGDKVNIYGCTNTALNVSTTVLAVGTGYIKVDVNWSASVTQTDVIAVKRTGFTQIGGITFSRTAPSMDYVCEHNNRLWGCSSTNHEIYASKLGEFWNWNNYEGISTDSYAVTVGSDGDFTGCASNGGYVYFFKESTIHTMYGDKPSNFSLTSKALPGVRTGCSKSIQIVNESIYYVGRNGVYQFDGGIPEKISANITEEIKDAVAGQQDSRLYLSCKLNNVQTMLVFDQETGLWVKEDAEVIKYGSYGNGTMYYINGDNKLCTITGSDTGKIDWYLESGDIVEGSLEEKFISRVLLNFWLESGSEATFYTKYDDEVMFKRQGEIKSIKNTTYSIPIIPRRCNKFRYRIEGKGQFKLLGVGWSVEGGSELNGSIQHQHRFF